MKVLVEFGPDAAEGATTKMRPPAVANTLTRWPHDGGHCRAGIDEAAAAVAAGVGVDGVVGVDSVDDDGVAVDRWANADR